MLIYDGKKVVDVEMTYYDDRGNVRDYLMEERYIEKYQNGYANCLKSKYIYVKDIKKFMQQLRNLARSPKIEKSGEYRGLTVSYKTIATRLFLEEE